MILSYFICTDNIGKWHAMQMLSTLMINYLCSPHCLNIKIYQFNDKMPVTELLIKC